MSNTTSKKIIIIGGGIGGLATAVALTIHGFQVEVFEQAQVLRETGSGFIISPNGVKAIRRLGDTIINAVIAKSGDMSVFSRPYPFYDNHGKIRFEHSFKKLEKEYGAPMMVIHRQDFHRILQNTLDNNHVHCGMRFIKFTQDTNGVTVYFDNDKEIRGDLLIGADGLHSQVRKQLFGQEAPTYVGCTSVRGIVNVPNHPLINDRPGLQATGPGLQFYSMRMGGDSIYWTATPTAMEGEWMKLPLSVVKQRLLELFKDWHEPIPEMIKRAAAESLIVADIHDRPPLQTWSNDRVTLLGDAAHPMSPFMGQGANMAIEDAVCLVDCLQTEPDYQAALRKYEEKRIERTSRMVAQSRFLGKMGHLQNPFLCWLRDKATQIAMTLPNARSKSEWIFTYTP